jgi:hypothetical protein
VVAAQDFTKFPAFDVITSLVSLDYWGYGCEKVTSLREATLEKSGVTSLRDISIVGGHVTHRHSDVTIWPLRIEPPRKSVLRRAAGGMRAIR